MERYVITVKTTQGKIILREKFKGYDEAMDALDRCQNGFRGHCVEFRDTTPFAGRH